MYIIMFAVACFAAAAGVSLATQSFYWGLATSGALFCIGAPLWDIANTIKYR